MKKVTALGWIKNGKLELVSRKVFANEIAVNKDQEVEVTVRTMGKIRSTNQLRYYRGVVVKLIAQAIEEHEGEPQDPEIIHQWLAKKFIPISKWNPIEQNYETTGQSTSELNTTEFTVYIDQCRSWASMVLQTQIPDPDPEYKTALFY